MGVAMTRSPSAAASRRAARETALRILYTLELARPPVEEVLAETIAANELDAAAAAHATALIHSIEANRPDLDEAISLHAIGYPPDKQTVVDRNILRLALAELLFPVADTPPGVIANEAVELAKKYSTPEAARFLNGILGTAIRVKEDAAAIIES